jgi:hypothetical protein
MATAPVMGPGSTFGSYTPNRPPCFGSSRDEDYSSYRRDVDRPMDTCAHLTPRVPSTTYHVYLTPCAMCTLQHVYTSSLHLSIVLSHEITPDPIEPRHCILDFGQVILHMTALHHTKFSPHIRSIIKSAFGRTTYQINTSLESR